MAVGDHAGEGLGDAPGQVLQRHGHGEGLARPAPVHADRQQEQPLHMAHAGPGLMTPPASTMTHGRAGVTRGGEEEAARGMADSGVASAPCWRAWWYYSLARARSTDYFSRSACARRMPVPGGRRVSASRPARLAQASSRARLAGMRGAHDVLFVNGSFSIVTFIAAMPATLGYSARFPTISGRHTMRQVRPGNIQAARARALPAREAA